MLNKTHVETENKAHALAMNSQNPAIFARKFTLGLSLLALTTLAFFSGSMLMSATAQAEDGLNPTEQQEVKAIVKEMLLSDPNLLKEAVIAMQMREMAQQQASVKDVIMAEQQALFHTASDPWKGAENPELTMVYFTDFNCPYCKKLEPELDKLMTEFPKLKIIIKMVPLQGQSAVDAVDLAQTVWLNEPAKYAKVKQTLMAVPRRLDSSTITKVANMTDTTKWLDNTDSRVADAVSANLQLMRKLGIGGTPSMIIGDEVVAGLVPFTQLKQHVEQALKASNDQG